MAGLTQAAFAARLKEAMKRLDWSGVGLADEMRVADVTISRWRRASYESGPPKPKERRELEEVMGLPTGYLDGLVSADLAAIAAQPSEKVLGRSSKRAADPLAAAYAHAVDTLTELAAATGHVRVTDALRCVNRLYSVVSGVPVSELPASALTTEPVTSPEPGAKPDSELEHVTRHRTKAKAAVEAASPPPGQARRRTGQG